VAPAPWRALSDALASSDRVLLTGPIEPDGDSVGACLALQRLLAARGVRVDVAGDPAARYQWMPGACDILRDADVAPTYDAVVVLDGDRHRLVPSVKVAFDAARVKGLIDHHASSRHDGYTHAWIDRVATSTCEMLYDVLRDEGVPLDPELATLLYVGAVFDTGGFRYSNTTPATHRMAAVLLETGIDHAAIAARILMERRVVALRATGHVFASAELLLDGALAVGTLSRADQQRLGLAAGDLEGIVDALVYTEGVEVAALLVEKEPGRVKASLRSRGKVDVARLAGDLAPSGGGHAKAAGALRDDTLEGTRQALSDLLAARLAEIERRRA